MLSWCFVFFFSGPKNYQYAKIQNFRPFCKLFYKNLSILTFRTSFTSLCAIRMYVPFLKNQKPNWGDVWGGVWGVHWGVL